MDGLDGVEVELAEVVALDHADLVVGGLAASHLGQQVEVGLVALVGLELSAGWVVEVGAGLVGCSHLLESSVALFVCLGYVGGVLGDLPTVFVILVDICLVFKADLEWFCL